MDQEFGQGTEGGGVGDGLHCCMMSGPRLEALKPKGWNHLNASPFTCLSIEAS